MPAMAGQSRQEVAAADVWFGTLYTEAYTFAQWAVNGRCA